MYTKKNKNKEILYHSSKHKVKKKKSKRVGLFLGGGIQFGLTLAIESCSPEIGIKKGVGLKDICKL